MIKFQPTRRQRFNSAIARILDWVYSPVINRLTSDEYFSSRTRNDCVRALAKRLVHA